MQVHRCLDLYIPIENRVAHLTELTMEAKRSPVPQHQCFSHIPNGAQSLSATHANNMHTMFIVDKITVEFDMRALFTHQ